MPVGWGALRRHRVAAASLVVLVGLFALARGYAYKQIGLRLGISARTVGSHVGAVLRKLQLTSRQEVAHWAVTHGLVGDGDDG
jgi:hypothetical protein